jgi:predicted TIM-barrel fold metal-dependent hydrolase
MMRRVGRWGVRLAAAIAGLALLLAASCSWLTQQVGGKFTHAPEEWRSVLSPAARELIERTLAELPSAPVDYHTHLAGLGDSGSGIGVNPKMRSWWHPILLGKFSVYMSSSGVSDLSRSDQQFLDRLVALVRASPRPARHGLIAFDRHFDASGDVNEIETEMHVPNDHILAVCKLHPDLFAPVMSVHPYRKDAIAELERCAAGGAKLCKWLPNAMGMDPSDPRCDPFYDRMRELGVALVCHTGREEAVDAEDAQRLGNVLRLRRALDHGVKVIAAHCSSFGEDEDLDDPARPLVPSFQLFLRMMGEKRYEGLLFGDLSATTEFNRDRSVLTTLLERTDLHPRLVNGSDYPIPAINFLVWTGRFVKWGLITSAERELLDEIYGVNPLLFDMVLKRVLEHPTSGTRFPASIFVANPLLPIG